MHSSPLEGKSSSHVQTTFKILAFCIGQYELKYDLNLVISTNKEKIRKVYHGVVIHQFDGGRI